ncbi:MAG: T9SS type A sorting domain-containing protein [candidate division WOR-3 bacterium]
MRFFCKLLILTGIAYGYIRILEPNGGETFYPQEKHAIHWVTSSSTGYVRIEYTLDGGTNWFTITSSAPNNGYYLWTVPNQISELVKIRVTNVADTFQRDESDNVFSIRPPQITLTYPNGNNTFRLGDKMAIRWTWRGIISNVKIEYSPNGGISWFTVISNTSNTGSYIWSIPTNLTPGSQYLIKVSDVTNAQCYDQSDTPFEIVQNTLTLLYPNGGEYFVANRDYPVVWSSTGSISNVRIEYTLDGGNTWNTVISSTPNDGSHTFTAPSTPTNSFKIRISDASNPQISDEGDNFSSIGENSLTLLEPRNNAELIQGEYQAIHWDWIGNIQSVKLEYSLDGGNSWTPIATSTNNDGSHYFQVPTRSTEYGWLRIQDYNNPNIRDSVRFKILPAQIRIITPKPGDSLSPNSSYSILWEVIGKIPYVRIEFSNDGGNTWRVIQSNLQNTGTYVWTVDTTSSSNCLIKISDPNDANAYALAGPFVIKNTNIKIISPSSGQELWPTERIGIQWVTEGYCSRVNLYLSRDNGLSWDTITTNLQNVGTYLWSIPNSPSTSCRIKVENTRDPNIYSVSDSFIIRKPEISVKRPVLGETLLVGARYPIRWESRGSLGNVKIELLYKTESGVQWLVLAANTPDDGTEYFTVPIAVSDSCWIKITSVNDPSVFDSSDIFVIAPAKPVLLFPNDSVTFIQGERREISFYTLGSDTVKAYYSTNNGINWVFLGDHYTKEGSINWKLPTNVASNSCLVKVQNFHYPQEYVISSLPFKIAPAELYFNGMQKRSQVYAGIPFPIHWRWTGEIYNDTLDIQIKLLPSGSTTTYVVRNDGYALVTLPQTDTIYELKLINHLYPTSFVTCTLQVTSPPEIPTDSSIIFIEPRVNDTLHCGDSLFIYWLKDSRIDNVSVWYSVNDTFNFTLVASGVNTNSYIIKVPEFPNSRLYLKIMWMADTTKRIITGPLYIKAPKINIVYPDSSTIWYVGSKHRIYWKNSAIIDTVDIFYSYDNGRTFYPIVTNLPDTAYFGTYIWTIPNIPSDSVRILIRHKRLPTQVAETSMVFRVIPQRIFVYSPKKTDTLTAGTTYYITWQNWGRIDNVNIRYSVDGGINWNIVASNVNTTGYEGSYLWTVPTSSSGQVLIKVENSANPNCYGLSDTFCIVPQTIELISPKDEPIEFITGRTYHITWRSKGAFQQVRISYSLDNGRNYTTLTTTTNTGYYTWYSFPEVYSDSMRIKVEAVLPLPISSTSGLLTARQGKLTLTNLKTSRDSFYVGSKVHITWASTGGVIQFKLYYSTDSSQWVPITTYNVSGSSYEWQIPEALSDKEFIVKVEAANESRVFSVSQWQFARRQIITVKSPNRFSQFVTGRKYYITWGNTGTINNVNLYYSIDGGETFNSIIPNYSNNAQYYEWTVPSSPSTACIIKITNTQNEQTYGLSDTFTIPQQRFEISYPYSNCILVSGNKYFICWNTIGAVPQVNIEYSTNNGNTWTYIATGVLNYGKYEWTVPPDSSNNCVIRISSTSDSRIFTISQVFTIVPQSFEFLTPVMSDTLISGLSAPITWRTTGQCDRVNLEYSIDGGASWNPISLDLQNTNGYNWNVPLLPNTSVLLRIYNPQIPSVRYLVPNVYIQKPIFEFITPDTSSYWYAGRTYYITWRNIGNIPTLDIFYSTDTGRTWNLIAQNQSNQGYFQWTLPGNIFTEHMLLKVASSTASAVYYISDPFKSLRTEIQEAPHTDLILINSLQIRGGFVHLNIYSTETNFAKIEIFDAMGRKIIKTQREVLKGYNEIRVTERKLNQGVYFLHLKVGKIEKQVKLIVTN